MTLLAHAGHWIEQALYLLPVVGLVGALAWAKYKDRANSDQKPEV
ncbi:MAG TPA: hypothetical protein VFZ00_12460 [Solirubrobacter sp.]|nr:hypothetical protein [Solirubrobacter sp.]